MYKSRIRIYISSTWKVSVGGCGSGWAFEKSLFSCPRPPVAPSHLPHKHNNTHALPLAFSLSRVGGGERYLRPIEMKAITSGVRALNKCHEEMMEKSSRIARPLSRVSVLVQQQCRCLARKSRSFGAVTLRSRDS